MINLPGYDNNVFSEPGQGAVIQQLLTSPNEPLFNRAVDGYYNPGSTIKPLDAVAALSEGVIDSTREIFSPGYLLVPNPYNSSTPSRFLDWQYQGNVNLASALAQSSDVYFYIVGGGSPPRSYPAPERSERLRHFRAWHRPSSTNGGKNSALASRPASICRMKGSDFFRRPRGSNSIPERHGFSAIPTTCRSGRETFFSRRSSFWIISAPLRTEVIFTVHF